MTYPEIKKQVEKIRKLTIQLAQTNYGKWNANGLITTDGQYAHAQMQNIMDALSGIEMVL